MAARKQSATPAKPTSNSRAPTTAVARRQLVRKLMAKFDAGEFLPNAADVRAFLVGTKLPPRMSRTTARQRVLANMSAYTPTELEGFLAALAPAAPQGKQPAKPAAKPARKVEKEAAALAHIEDVFTAFQTFQTATRHAMSNVRNIKAWKAQFETAQANLQTELGRLGLADKIDWSER